VAIDVARIGGGKGEESKENFLIEGLRQLFFSGCGTGGKGRGGGKRGRDLALDPRCPLPAEEKRGREGLFFYYYKV